MFNYLKQKTRSKRLMTSLLIASSQTTLRSVRAEDYFRYTTTTASVYDGEEDKAPV